MSATAEKQAADYQSVVRKHTRVGWCSLLIFLSLGVLLEVLHGLKVGWYLDVSNETRRLMWTLAHTHGTLLGLIHLGFAATLATTTLVKSGPLQLISICLVSAGLLLPTGFFLGGLHFHGGDPGIGILLVPFGAALLLVAVGLIVLALFKDGNAMTFPAPGAVVEKRELPESTVQAEKPRRRQRSKAT